MIAHPEISTILITLGFYFVSAVQIGFLIRNFRISFINCWSHICWFQLRVWIDEVTNSGHVSLESVVLVIAKWFCFASISLLIDNRLPWGCFPFGMLQSVFAWKSVQLDLECNEERSVCFDILSPHTVHDCHFTVIVLELVISTSGTCLPLESSVDFVL